MQNPLALENTRLREKLDDATALVRDLSGDDVEIRFAMRRVFNLTSTQASFLACMFRRKRMTYGALYTAIYGMRHADDQPDISMMKALACAVRKKLASHGVTIELSWGIGYEMTANSIAKLRTLLADDLPVVESPPLAATLEQVSA
jgi:hypothetical protein